MDCHVYQDWTVKENIHTKITDRNLLPVSQKDKFGGPFWWKSG